MTHGSFWPGGSSLLLGGGLGASAGRVVPFFNNGRWVANCPNPQCANAEDLDPEWVETLGHHPFCIIGATYRNTLWYPDGPVILPEDQCQWACKDHDRFMCTCDAAQQGATPTCRHEGLCGYDGPIPWPANRRQIEAELYKRPNPANRNWLPHESVDGLKRENVEHGII